jgi:general secretion pathway protein H
MKPDTEAGFTLAEILVVLAITALAAALALPSLKAKETARSVLLTTERVAAILQAGRLRAIGQNQPVAISFSLTDRIFRMDGAVEITIPEDMELELLTARGDRFGSDPSFRFFADRSSTGGSIKLIKGGNTGFIKVKWLTGQVAMEMQRQTQ